MTIRDDQVFTPASPAELAVLELYAPMTRQNFRIFAWTLAVTMPVVFGIRPYFLWLLLDQNELLSMSIRAFLTMAIFQVGVVLAPAAVRWCMEGRILAAVLISMNVMVYGALAVVTTNLLQVPIPVHLISMQLVIAYGGLIAYVLLLVSFFRLARRYHTQPICQNGEYNLTGNESGVCPECGTAISSMLRQRIEVDRKNDV